MGENILENGYVYYVDDSSKKKILNLNDFLYNKSKIPFHIFDRNGACDYLNERTLLGKCININQKMHNIYNPQSSVLQCSELLTFLLANFCTHSTNISNFAFIGCEEKILYSAISVIGEYNQLFRVTIIQDEICNGGENYFLDVLSNIEKVPEMSLNISDYHSTMLRDKYFDLVVVDCNVLGENIELKIKEINRIYSAKGSIIYILNGQLDVFKYINEMYDGIESYNISDNIKILSVKSPLECFEKNDDRSVISKYAYLGYIDKFNLCDEQIRIIIQEIEDDIEFFIKKHDIDKKIMCMELKENLISYMLFNEYKPYYLEQIRRILLKKRFDML